MVWEISDWEEACSQQEASKRPAEASKKPAASQQDASKDQQEAKKRPQMRGTPRNTETIEKQPFS